MAEQEGHVDRILRRSRAMGTEARELRDEIGAAAREIREKVDVTDSIREHPLRAVAFGLAAGYVLGGGLCARSTPRRNSPGMWPRASAAAPTRGCWRVKAWPSRC